MARYKGKREEHHGETASAPEQTAPVEQENPDGAEPAAPQQEPVGDPFAGDAFAENADGVEQKPAGTPFLKKKAVRITAIVLCCVLAFAIGGTLAVRNWLDHQEPILPEPPEKVEMPEEKPEEKPHIPTDDELYPDDGYGGEMPEVTGDRREGVYTFLLVGTDMDDGNTDTIMVASYDTVNQKVAIMSIPRDTMINEKWDIKKINSVYSRTGNSIEALSNRVKKLVGFKPDYYIKVKLSMFVELIDLVGGVEFDVPQDMNYDDPYQDLHIHLKKGVQTLDGEHAMELVRFRRYAEGDIQRIRVQQDFMKALIRECMSLKHWGKIKAYIDLAMDNIDTNLEMGSVVWLAANVLGLNKVPALSMDNVSTFTLPGNYIASCWSRAVNGYQSYVTIYPNKVVELVNEHFNPYVQKVTTGMLDAMSILENGDIASSTGNVKDTQHNEVMAVKRGEAYYDAEGKLVYGVKPKQDENGNYYIENEDGTVTYTDEKGNPLGTDPALPPSPDAPIDPNAPVDPNAPEVPETPGDPNTPDPNGSTDPADPAEPVPGGEQEKQPGSSETGTPENKDPAVPGEGGADTEMPDWLAPQNTDDTKK